MESAKEKAIREAYGEHWETVKQHVNENGYLYHPKGGEVTFDPFIGFMEEHPTYDAYRPKSLQGIESNNGWIRIESESDLPTESTYCWFILNNESGLKYGRFIISLSKVKRFFLYEGGHYDFKIVSHYKQVSKPQTPIY